MSLRVPYRLDLYVLRTLAAPLGFVLATVLIAQLLERLLRLFELVATTGAPVVSVFKMAAYLVPHYLGIALPAAFTIAMFLALARLSDDSEIDIFLTSGRSLARIALPYFGLSIALGAFSLYLFGALQPLSRYAYRAAVYEAMQTRWDSRVEANRFGTAGGGILFNVEETDPDGRGVRGVFVQRRSGEIEEITTAPRGRLVPSSAGHLLLELESGLMVRDDANGKVWFGRFAKALYTDDFTPAPRPFRPRGDTVRELTLPELWQGLRDPTTTTLAPSRLAGEFHGRLARSLMLPLLPLLAIPLGMAAKRGRRAAGAVFAGLALLLLNHTLQFGESIAERGRANAALAVWTPVAVFGVLCVWVFWSSRAWPGENAVTRAATRVGESMQRLRRYRPGGSR